MSRNFDLVLFGATGFTGKLVAEYLAQHAPMGTRIALAGRSKDKLETVRRGLPGGAREWPILLADAADDFALGELARQTKVVCTTVGPYAKYGLPLVGACAKHGTHYCDLTGEVQFMRDSIDRYDAAAKSSGARIVHTCGFDSIPSDLGVLFVHQKLGTLKRVTGVMTAFKGGFSGGTVASMLHMQDEVKADPSRRKLLFDAYALSPKRDEEPNRGKERDLMKVEQDDFTGMWLAPWFMEMVNARVVRRTNALLGYAYGRDFRYREVVGMKPGVTGALRAFGFTAGLAAFMGALTFDPTRKLLEKRLPKPGEGPDEKTRKSGYMTMKLFAESESGERKTFVVSGQGDPGYQLTSLILSQAALCLALDDEKLPRAVSGVLTPATAMGQVLIDRLVAAGMTFGEA